MRHGRSVGHEIECRARVIRAEVELGQVARSVNADRVGGSRVEARRRVRREPVLIAVPNHGEHAVVFAGRLRHRPGDRAGLRPRHVVHILRLPRRDVRRDEGERNRARRLDSRAIQGRSLRVGQSEKPTVIVPSWAIAAAVILITKPGRTNATRLRIRIERFLVSVKRPCHSAAQDQRQDKPAEYRSVFDSESDHKSSSTCSDTLVISSEGWRPSPEDPESSTPREMPPTLRPPRDRRRSPV